MIDAFHFLRPQWLLLLPVIALLGVWLWQRQRSHGQWQSLIRAELLSHLLDAQPTQHSRWPLLALLCGWLVATLALAGPTWQKLPQPVYSQQDALVLIVDLSPSMLAQDIKPNRLTHAKHRLIDLIKARTQGLTALVVYAGDAHVLSPLSDDRQTLLALAPPLTPAIMPLRGSQTEAAIATALSLLRDAGHARGQLLLITDGVTASAASAIKPLLRDSGVALSILGVGSAEGAPIPLSDGRFATNAQGTLQLARLNANRLQALATELGGIYRNLAFDGSDSQALLAHIDSQRPLALNDPALARLEQTSDLWHEFGPWLVLLLLPIAALSHRRGLLLTLLLLPQLVSEPAYALEWQPLWQQLWQTPDQQAAQAFDQGAHEQAAQQFQNPDWRGSALYRNGQYPAAATSFNNSDSADGHYNRGNALAKAGQLQDALDAYQQALNSDPTLDDARFNQQLVQRLLEQQQEEQQKEEQQDQQQQQNQDQDQDQQSQDQDQDQDQQGQNPNQQSESANDSGDSDSDSKPTDQGQSSSPPPSTASEPTDSDQQDAGQQDVDQQNSGQQNPDQPQHNPPADSQAEAESTQQAEQAPQPAQANQTDDASGSDTPATASSADAPGKPDPRLEQWLRQLPEDPSGLLRRKFEYQYQQKLEAYRQGRWQPPEETRW